MNCRIFETDTRHCQQILVRLDNNDDGDLCLYFTIWPEDMPIFTATQVLTLTCDSDDARQKLRDMTDEQALDIVGPALRMIDA